METRPSRCEISHASLRELRFMHMNHEELYEQNMLSALVTHNSLIVSSKRTLI